MIVVFWSLVFTKSKGWNKTVENVPEKDPARKAFATGYCNKKLPIYKKQHIKNNQTFLIK